MIIITSGRDIESESYGKKRAKVGVTTERELPLPSHMYKVTTWWGGKIEQVNPGQAIVMK